jgi:hypothetical protein
MTPEELAWVAGLFEGEGSVSFRITHREDAGRGYNRSGGSLRLEINMTDRDVLDVVKGITGVGRVYGPYDRGGRRAMHGWIVTSGSDVRALCERLRPLLFSRRQEQIDAALAGYASRYRRCAACAGRRFQCRDCYDAWAKEVAA